MQIFGILFPLSVLLHAVAATTDVLAPKDLIPESPHALEQRDEVQNCKALLVALKASAFCSSFVPIVKNTATQTRTGPVQFTTAIVTPTPATATTTETAGGGGGGGTIIERGAAPTCTIPGLPYKIKPFGCEVIKKACLLFVKPGTTTRTTTIPGSTSTSKTTLATQTVTTTTTFTPLPTCDAGPYSPPIPDEENPSACGCSYDILCDVSATGTVDARVVQARTYKECAQRADFFSNTNFFVFDQATLECLVYQGGDAGLATQKGVVVGLRDVESCSPVPENLQCNF
ncbi:hypothetical protein VTL71DRAFT_1220 [Oculimacula yallundae]|uniref:Uncharacterized protein n=1 Tax=Oculimacula yallundae TaxID=86028 RepID=A0ABR4CC01_9HELO